MRSLAENHNIAVIASIHQPNHEIVMMCNTVYVLAKGGHCLYSGSADCIEQFLNQCNIVLDEDQVPVEGMLKLASIQDRNSYIDAIIDKTRESLKKRNLSIETHLKDSSKGLKKRRKSFKLSDTCHLIDRSLAEIRAQQWKVYFWQLLFYIFYPLMNTLLFNEDIGKPDGCFSFGRSKTCVKDIEDNESLSQNQTFIFFTIIAIQFIHISCVTMSSVKDTKMFVNEHHNGKL